jgi:hypothetical protein
MLIPVAQQIKVEAVCHHPFFNNVCQSGKQKGIPLQKHLEVNKSRDFRYSMRGVGTAAFLENLFFLTETP